MLYINNTKVLFGQSIIYWQCERHCPMNFKQNFYYKFQQSTNRAIQCIGVSNMREKKVPSNHPSPSFLPAKSQPDLSSVSSKSTLKEWPLLRIIFAELASYSIQSGRREESYFTSLVLISIGDCWSPSAIGKSSFQWTGPWIQGTKREGLNKWFHSTNICCIQCTVLEIEERTIINKIRSSSSIPSHLIVCWCF